MRRGPEAAGMCGELGEVLGRGVRVDDPVPGHAREPDVRHGGEREAVAAHLGQRCERRLDARAVVCARGGDAELGEPVDRFPGGQAGKRLGAGVEGQHCEDRQGGDAADGFDRRLELLELEERLDREEVDSAAFEHGGLLGEDLDAFGLAHAKLAQRPDRAGDEDIAAGHLAGVAGQLDGGAVDLFELVLEVMRGELAAVGPERVRLDHVRAGLDEADMELDDGLWGAEVRLLGDAHAGGGARDEDAHAAVGDERRGRSRAVRGSGWPSAEPTSGVRPGNVGWLASGHRAHLHRSRR